MQRFLSNIYLLPLAAAAFGGMRASFKKWPLPYKTFGRLMVLILFIEVFSVIWAESLHKSSFWEYAPNNIWIYNTFLLPQYILYFRFYLSILVSNVLKKAVLISGITFLCFYILDLTVIQDIYTPGPYALILANIIIVLLNIAYFHQLLNRIEISPLKKEPAVWITLGSFIFHLGSLPFFISLYFLTVIDIVLADALLWLITGLNTIMYSFYLIAFLCPHPIHK